MNVTPRSAAVRRAWLSRPRPALPGERFGRLTVLEILPSEKKRGMRLCQCSCGQTKKVATSALMQGHTKSCGCLAGDKGGFRHHHVPGAVNPIVRKLFEEMNSQCCTASELAERAGVPPETFKAWKRYTVPRLDTVEACLNALGLELQVR